ncbi:M1 family aminopeptidase [Terrimonas ferruginea]|uniref:M1 family aminopeptidase n=1 Tax=Terrimonas ferruginea TaxID=249 RepID=UPI0003FECA68|nr:M1 family aminopeptidase [Terrimonas ferruginea]
MKAILLFDLRQFARQLPGYVILLLLLCMGIFTGNKFNMSAGEGVELNSPYTIGFMLGLLSLTVIFIATFFAIRMLFSEWDNRVNLLIFTTPVRKRSFATGRFLSLWLLTLSGFLFMITGFVIGQQMRDTGTAFHFLHYAYPWLFFGVINSLLVCSVLYFAGWATQNKMLVAVMGLLLYVLYMVILLFSNSPFMAQSAPQSVEAQQVSAVIDPFGVSAYFLETRNFSVQQRNTLMVPLSGYWLLNRMIAVLLSLLFVWLGARSFSIHKKIKKTREPKALAKSETASAYFPVVVNTGKARWLKSLRSYVGLDLKITLRSISFVLSAIVLLFLCGMEMYADIEKGIRLPGKYADSGLMATSISENFYLPAVLLVVYFVYDLYWKSYTSRFQMLERTSVLSSAKYFGHWISVSALVSIYTVLLLLLGLLFQFVYAYPRIDWAAYAGLLVFNTLPLMLLTGFLVWINSLFTKPFIGLGVTLILAFLLAGPFSAKLLSYPLLRFFSGFKGTYSDFCGYGAYLRPFVQRWLAGAALTGLLWILTFAIRRRRISLAGMAMTVVCIVMAVFSGMQFMTGYVPRSSAKQQDSNAAYEQHYRHYQRMPQPAVTDVVTKIDLYPSQQAYTVDGYYVLRNLTSDTITKVLINFTEGFVIQQAILDGQSIDTTVKEITLGHPMQPGDSLQMSFAFSYKWHAVNGHQSFNAIVENGSFMRISRYYPAIGYQQEREISEERIRRGYGLGAATALKTPEDPRDNNWDFVQLKMTVSTEKGQTPLGTGDLVKQWDEGSRTYAEFSPAQPVPFRFAVASAAYTQRKTNYKGTEIMVLYHPLHEENVDHLVDNIKQTMDYCEANFGPYPFRSIRFAEVSSFTRGFAATAYPGIIFMTENMVFHADLGINREQDVINELAGHELSHLWWGNSQLSGDERQGSVMLTETLAMYTEMMLYRRMYGEKRMRERLAVHQQLYDEQKGFSAEEPLYKVTGNNTHIAYSKGAIVMVRIAEMIGEEKVNLALRNLLAKHRYPLQRPVSTDLIDELLAVSREEHHAEIRKLMMER